MELTENKCKNCGAAIDTSKAVGGVVTCEYCQSVFTLTKQSTPPKTLTFLKGGEANLDTRHFDEAFEMFQRAANETPDEPEAYFGMALAAAQVQYLKDFRADGVTKNGEFRMQPICYSVSGKKFTQDKNYLKALKYATPEQKAEYKRKGAEIDHILEEFYGLEKSGLDYDCFICVKVTDAEGGKTEDSNDAKEIYDLLKKKGYTPFYSEAELKNVTGADYEARILYALYTSECMLVVCREEEYLQTPWVKNEYSRFLKLLNDKEKESDSITIIFNKKPIEKLSGRSGKLQGIDFSKRSAYDDIVDFVEKHTPQARKRREEAAAAKAKADNEREKRTQDLEKQQRDLNEQQRDLNEQQKKLEEQQRKINETLDKLTKAEQQRNLEEQQRRYDERRYDERLDILTRAKQRRDLDEQQRLLEEQQKKLNETLDKLTKAEQRRDLDERQRIYDERRYDERFDILTQAKQRRDLDERQRRFNETPDIYSMGARRTVSDLLTQAWREMDARNFKGADNYFTTVLEKDGQNAEAWRGKFLCSQRATSESKIEITKNNAAEILNNENFNNFLKYKEDKSYDMECNELLYNIKKAIGNLQSDNNGKIEQLNNDNAQKIKHMKMIKLKIHLCTAAIILRYLLPFVIIIIVDHLLYVNDVVPLKFLYIPAIIIFVLYTGIPLIFRKIFWDWDRFPWIQWIYDKRSDLKDEKSDLKEVLKDQSAMDVLLKEGEDIQTLFDKCESVIEENL